MAEETTETTQAPAPITDAFGGTAPAPAPEPAPEADASPPDVGDALKQLNARFDSIEGRLPQAETPPPVDAWERLTQPPEPEYEEEAPAAVPELPQGSDDALVEEFNKLVREQAQQVIEPHLQAQAREQRRIGVQQLAEKYPDFAEAIPVIGRQMEQLAQRYGRPEMAEDPELAESLYQAHKAAAVAAGETPAEAAGQATLETQTGTGQGTEEPSLHDQYMAPILALRQGGDAFS